MSRRDYDILHLHLQASSLLGATIAPLFRRVPILVTVYALKQQFRWPWFYLFSIISPMIRRFVSLWDNSDLPSVGVNKGKIEVIPIGIDFRGADPTRHLEVRRALCQQYGFNIDQPLLLSVARLAADRHIHLLVESMKYIVAECPQARLLMVGEGEERERLEAFIQEHQLNENVIFAGVRTDLWDIYPGCDVYLSTSGDCDTGVAAMQAMACERPVVTYTIAQMTEPQKLCDCQGVFIQTRDPKALATATLQLLHDPTQARRLGQRGREKVLKDFSLDAMLQHHIDLYREYVADAGY
jgi:glycosyltransferase involved in cell wall biosynthesis